MTACGALALRVRRTPVGSLEALFLQRRTKQRMCGISLPTATVRLTGRARDLSELSTHSNLGHRLVTPRNLIIDGDRRETNPRRHFHVSP